MVRSLYMVFLISFLFGVLMSNILFDGLGLLIFLSGATILFLGMYLFFKKEHYLIFFSYMGLFFGSLYSFAHIYDIQKKIDILEPHFGQNQNFYIQVDAIYKSKGEKTTYIGHDMNVPDVGLIFQIISPQKYKENDVLEVSGQLSKIPVLSETFLYDRFLFSKGVYGQILYPNIQSHQFGQQNILFQKIQLFRDSLIRQALFLFPKNEAALALGILIGNTQYFDDQVWSDYTRAGLSHLVAVSGYNITLVIIFIGAFIFFLPRWIRFVIMVGSIFIFTLLVGASLSVVRAAIMGVLGYWVVTMGRSGNAYGIFCVTAFLLVGYEPLLLPYDLSFLLSFLAVLGLLSTQYFWNKVFFWVPKFFALRESLVLTLSALTTTFPVLCFQFGKIAYFSIISNILVGGLMPFAMLFSAGALFFGYISEWMGYRIGYGAYFLLHFVVLVAEFFGGISWGVQEFAFGRVAFYFEGAYFLFFFFLLFYWNEQKKENISL